MPVAWLVVVDVAEDRLRPYDAEAAAMSEQVDDALVLMERALVSRDPLELALAGFLSAYKGRTFDKQRRLIKHYVDWCLQNDLPPLQAKRPHPPARWPTRSSTGGSRWTGTTGTTPAHPSRGRHERS